jgi:hypothetical protein
MPQWAADEGRNIKQCLHEKDAKASRRGKKSDKFLISHAQIYKILMIPTNFNAEKVSVEGRTMLHNTPPQQ